MKEQAQKHGEELLEDLIPFWLEREDN